MLPVSAKDIIEFRPALDRVNVAKQVLLDAQSANPKNPIVVSASEMAVSDAEISLAANDPIYQIRVPTIRSKMRFERDVSAEPVALRENVKMIDCVIAYPEVGPEYADFLASVKATTEAGSQLSMDDWVKFHGIARSVPAASAILADFAYQRGLRQFHAIRHFLIIEGQPSPLPENAVDALPEEDLGDIAAKIESLISPDKATEKN